MCACVGLLFSVLITAVITDAIKDAVGRPRPDFFWRCFPNGTGVGFIFVLSHLHFYSQDRFNLFVCS